MSDVHMPWRYRCPKCGSVCISKYTGKPAPARNEIVKRYYCRNCRAKFDTPKDMLGSGSGSGYVNGIEIETGTEF